MVYSIAAIKYPQDPQTTMNTTNTVPGNLQMSITTLYYKLYTMFIMRFTGSQFTPLFFAFRWGRGRGGSMCVVDFLNYLLSEKKL